MTYSAIKEVSPVLDENIYKDPQPDNADHERSPSNPSPHHSRNSGRDGKKFLIPREDGRYLQNKAF